MSFQQVEQALRALENYSLAPAVREQAAEYLSRLDEQDEIRQLVDALQNDAFGIRWEAAKMLAHIGRRAVPAVLEALIDPLKVGDLRLRHGAYQVLHENSDYGIRAEASKLLGALHGPSPDLDAMHAANELWIKLRLGQKNHK